MNEAELQKEEVMHDRYEIEVGDIVQVTETTLYTQFYKLGDIGRVHTVGKDQIYVDFSISKNHYIDPSKLTTWVITTKFVTKINVIQEGDSRTDADRQEEYDNEEEP